MIYYSKNEEVEAYFNNPAVDQSKLKKLILGLSGLVEEKEQKLYFEEKESLVIGSLVDGLITLPKEDFEEKYYVSNLGIKPSDTVMSIINYVYDSAKASVPESDVLAKLPLAYFKTPLNEAIELHAYQKGWKMETKVNKILESSAYFEELKASSGKQVISVEEAVLAKAMVDNIKKVPVLEQCFNNDDEDIDIFFQKPIYFSYKGVACKALPDIVIYNRRTGIIWLIDLKTTFYSVLNFYMAVQKYRYDIQLAFYKEALQGLYPNNVINTGFVVESSSTPGTPLYYVCNDDLLKQGKSGLPALNFGSYEIRKKVKGFDDLIEDYIYYQENGFHEDKLITLYKESDQLTLGLNGIVEDK